jgi:hypothetical protein
LGKERLSTVVDLTTVHLGPGVRRLVEAFLGKFDKMTDMRNPSDLEFEKERAALVKQHLADLDVNPVTKHEPANEGGSIEDFGTLFREVVRKYTPTEYLKKLFP